jgi:hypothetical protein
MTDMGLHPNLMPAFVVGTGEDTNIRYILFIEPHAGKMICTAYGALATRFLNKEKQKTKHSSRK